MNVVDKGMGSVAKIEIDGRCGTISLTKKDVAGLVAANEALLISLLLSLSPHCFNRCADYSPDEIAGYIELAEKELSLQFHSDFLKKHNVLEALRNINQQNLTRS